VGKLFSPQAVCEKLAPRVVEIRGPSHGEKIAVRRRALGRQVRQIDPQQLARRQIQWIFAKKVDAFDHGVLSDDQIEPRTPGDHSRIVHQVQSLWSAKRQGPE
jgi:hypothetical protein